MKWLVIVVAIFALLADVGTATAQKKSKKNYSSSQSAFVQRDVSRGFQSVPNTNGANYSPVCLSVGGN